MPGAPFLLAAALLVLALVIAVRTLAHEALNRRVGKAKRAHHLTAQFAEEMVGTALALL